MGRMGSREDEELFLERFFLININIGGTVMPLRVKRRDEELYRKAERLVGKTLDQYLLSNKTRSREEILVFVAYHFAVMLAKQESSESIEPLAQKIQDLNNELKQLLETE
jgi:uncharacterized protein (DUF1778 family)